HDSALGRETVYPRGYDPALLFPIPRAQGRTALGLGETLPFHGVDLWNGYELSWLEPSGTPRIALARFSVPAHSPNLIESKSFKLYLGSFAATPMPDAESLRERLAGDLSAAAGAPVSVQLVLPEGFAAERIEALAGECIDDTPVTIADY